VEAPLFFQRVVEVGVDILMYVLMLIYALQIYKRKRDGGVVHSDVL
jgi:hypothetical protein